MPDRFEKTRGKAYAACCPHNCYVFFFTDRYFTANCPADDGPGLVQKHSTAPRELPRRLRGQSPELPQGGQEEQALQGQRPEGSHLLSAPR